MNGQQLFCSFLPGVTAVLTAQPSWANTALVGQPELVVFPTSVLSSIYIVDIKKQPQIAFDYGFVTQDIVKDRNLLSLRYDSFKVSPKASEGASQQMSLVPLFNVEASFSAVINPVSVIASDSITSSSGQTAIASKTDRLAEATPRFEDAIVLKGIELSAILKEKVVAAMLLKEPLKAIAEDTNSTLTIADLYEVGLVSPDNPIASTPKPSTSSNIFNLSSNLSSEDVQSLNTTNANKTTSSKSLQLTTTEKNNPTLLTIAQLPPRDKGADALLNAPQNPALEWVAQSNAPASKPAIAVPSTPVNLVPPGTPAPSYLNPNPNPLQFPTTPSEVRIQGTQPVTLEQVLELARRNNRDLQTALLELERSRAALRQAQAELLPNLSINANVTRQQAASSQLEVEQQIRARPDLANQIPGDQPSSTLTGEARLTYSLYTSGRRQALIRQAEEQVRVSEFTLETQSETIRLTVTQQYYNLQEADEQVRINQSAVVNAQASLRDALALERAGVGTRFDVLRFQVNLANSQQNLTNSISQQRINQRQLATTLSISQSVNLIAADPVRLAGLWNQTLEDSIIQALQNRPELQQQLAQRNIGEQQRRQALSQLGPQLNLVASYDLLDRFNDNISVTDGYSVGVQASINLYEGGAARAQAAQARAAIAIAENTFANQRNLVRFEVEQAYSQLQSNLENVQTANTALEQAREALRLARLRFQAGVGTQTDVISAENDLTLSEGNRVQAILNYNRALAAIQRAVTIRGTR